MKPLHNDRGLQIAVFGVVMLSGYMLWRGRHRYASLKTEFDFDTNPATRHMVPMEKRITDKEALAAWLAAQEQQASSSSSSSGGAAKPAS